MRRWSCFIICILLMAVLAVPAMAAGGTQMTISASQENAKPGEEITFTVTISGSDPCKSYGLKLEYDEGTYELVGGECTVEGAMIGTFLPGKGFAVLYGKETVPEGTLGTFTLKVKENAAGGSAEVTGTPAVKNGSTSLDASVTGTQVAISAPEGAAVPKETTAPEPTVPQESAVPKETTVSKETSDESKPAEPTPGNSGQSAQSPFDQSGQSTYSQFNQQPTGQSGQSEQPEAQEAAGEMAGLEQEVQAAAQESPAASDATESGGNGWLMAAVAAVLVICAGALAVILVRKKKGKG